MVTWELANRWSLTNAKRRNTDKVSMESGRDERRAASCVTTNCMNTSYSWCPDAEQSYGGKQEAQMFRSHVGPEQPGRLSSHSASIAASIAGNMEPDGQVET